VVFRHPKIEAYDDSQAASLAGCPSTSSSPASGRSQRGRVKTVLRALRRTTQCERGQALIEMALVLPLVFVFLLALVDFGIAIDRREVLQHAVYEGSRQAIVGTTIDEIKDRTVAQSQGLLEADDVAVCYIDNDGNGDIGAGDDVRVSASYDYKFTIGSGELFDFFGASTPSISLTPHADSRLANGPQGAEPEC
jgi:hypothetical protein